MGMLWQPLRVRCTKVHFRTARRGAAECNATRGTRRLAAAPSSLPPSFSSPRSVGVLCQPVGGAHTSALGTGQQYGVVDARG